MRVPIIKTLHPRSIPAPPKRSVGTTRRTAARGRSVTVYAASAATSTMPLGWKFLERTRTQSKMNRTHMAIKNAYRAMYTTVAITLTMPPLCRGGPWRKPSQRVRRQAQTPRHHPHHSRQREPAREGKPWGSRARCVRGDPGTDRSRNRPVDELLTHSSG